MAWLGIETIPRSTASMNENVSWLTCKALQANKHEWNFYASPLTREIRTFAETFINSHAAMPSLLVEGDLIYTNEPKDVFRILDAGEFGRIDGILYSNGAVILQTKDGHTNVFVWVDKPTAELFRYPKPS